MIEEKENPVVFVSKMRSDQEIRWNTTEKEAYAIVYCLRKLE